MNRHLILAAALGLWVAAVVTGCRLAYLDLIGRPAWASAEAWWVSWQVGWVAGWCVTIGYVAVIWRPLSKEQTPGSADAGELADG